MLKFVQLTPAHSTPTHVTYCTVSLHPPVFHTCTSNHLVNSVYFSQLQAPSFIVTFSMSAFFLSLFYCSFSVLISLVTSPWTPPTLQPYPPPPLNILIPSGAVPGGQKGCYGGRGGDGGGPSRSDSVKSMMMGASKASRWQMTQGRAQSEDLKNSKWVEKEKETLKLLMEEKEQRVNGIQESIV